MIITKNLIKYTFLLLSLLLLNSCLFIGRHPSIDLTIYSDADLDSMKNILLNKKSISRQINYDEFGNKIEEIGYMNINQIRDKKTIEYKYDKNKNIIEEFGKWYSFEYDSTGKLTNNDCWNQYIRRFKYIDNMVFYEEMIHLKENELEIPSRYYNCKYDSLGNMIEKEDYDYKKGLNWKFLYSYDKNNNQTRELALDSKGNVDWDIRTQYNNKNHKVEVFNAYKTDTSTTTYAYEYDEFDNVIKITEVRKSGQSQSNSLKFQSFDEKNNLLKTILYIDNRLYEIEINTYNGTNELIDKYNLTSCGCGHNHQELIIYKYLNGKISTERIITDRIHPK